MNPTTINDEELPEATLSAFALSLAQAIATRYPDAPPTTVGFEAPRRPEFGDFATNAAFSLARSARCSPSEVAATLVADLRERDAELCVRFASIDAVAGFINLRLSATIWQNLVTRILGEGERFGAAEANGTRISLEFGSANPTGPLVVVQGRTLSIGDALAKTMRFCGYDVFTEWIMNDAGSQMDTLGRSIYARYLQRFDPSHPLPEDAYPGEYLLPIAERVAEHDGERWRDATEDEWHPHFVNVGRDALIAEQQSMSARFGVHFDLWQSEQALHDGGQVESDIAHLSELGLTYEKDGALFFRASAFGDDKDRVLRRTDGRPTYYGADVAYHYEKLKRADRVIDILGPDHHGYIGRLKGLATALGYPNRLDVLIAQQITLLRGGEAVSMSKRAGNIISLEEILDEVGVDAARFFFVMLAPDSPLVFDLDLAIEQSSENPVYYVQYGHARIASVVKNAIPDDMDAARSGGYVALLNHPAELALARRLAELPRVANGVVENLAPHRLTRYARDVATDFHQFYTACKILVDDRDLRISRLSLCLATKTVLARVLSLIGVSAPETM